MKNYQVRLQGENFLITTENGEEWMGFITTRWVKANGPEEAENKAVQLVREDKSLHSITHNKESQKDGPMIYLEELFVVGWWTYFRRSPGAGYTFYTQENGREHH